MSDSIREILFRQAQLYRGVTRTQFDKDRPGILPRDHVAASIVRANATELAAHHNAFGRPDRAALTLGEAEQQVGAYALPPLRMTMRQAS